MVRKKYSDRTHRRVRRQRSLGVAEALEARTMLTATPLGETLSLGSLSGTEAAVIAQRNDGQSIVVFQSDVGSTGRDAGSGPDIYLQRLDASGEPLGAPTVVNSMTRGAQLDPSVAVAADGSFLIVWSGRGAGDRVGIFGQRFSADGTSIGEELQIHTERGGDQTHADLAMAADGTAVVVWAGVGNDDASGVWMRRMAADGSFLGSQIRVNETVDGIQAYPSVGIDDEGNTVVAWSSRHQDGDGWGIFSRRFNGDGAAVGGEFQVNETTEGSQHQPAVAMARSGAFSILWSSLGQDGDSWGVYGQQYDVNGLPRGGEFAVNETTEGHQRDVDAVMAASGGLFVAWNDGQADGNGWEVEGRTFAADGVPLSSAIKLSDPNVLSSPGNQWNPSVGLAADGQAVVVYDGILSGNQLGVQAQRFSVEIGPVENVAPRLLNIAKVTSTVGESIAVTVTAVDDNFGDELTFSLDPELSPPDAVIEKTSDRTAVIRWTPAADDRLTDVNFRVFVDDEAGAGDAAQFQVTVRNLPPTVDLNGAAAGVNREVEFDPAVGVVPLADEQLTIADGDQSMLASASIRLRPILDGALESLIVDTAGTSIVASSYDPATGILSLAGEASLADYQTVLRTLRYANSASIPDITLRSVDITVNDGAVNSSLAIVSIDMNLNNDSPTLAALPDVELLAGSPLWISLDGSDADGDALTYTASSSDDFLVSTEIPTGNRSLRIDVAGFGEMVFQLFDDRVPRVTNQITTLANEGFYNGITFHRVIDDFVIQGGDPTATGTGGSRLGDFDDQFDVELQHNRGGILSMAKSFDDTNDSQFFITERATRSLDSQHSIFGVLVEGEAVREAISEVPVGAADRPLSDVTMNNVEVFMDMENGALLLSAPEGVTGTTQVTVEVRDSQGGRTSQTFNVRVVPDTLNSPPFLNDIPAIELNAGGTTSFTLTSQDVEGNAVVYLDQFAMNAVQVAVPVTAHPDLIYSVDQTTGVVSITATNGLTGNRQISVGVTPFLGSPDIDYQVVDVRII